MIDPDTWIFVDDRPQEAQAFVERLRQGDYAIDVICLEPSDARSTLFSGTEVAGVLVDVDLSAAQGETGTGPGIAQDMRVKQRQKQACECPVVRFALRERVDAAISGDPTSEDLFDLKIDKSEASRDLNGVQLKLWGVREVYSQLKDAVEAKLPEILGLDDDTLALFGHPSFLARIAAGLQFSHVAANTLMREFILATGLLIDERVLAVRLGIDANRSGSSWHEFRSELPFAYTGAGANQFPRWWARGLDEWWLDSVAATSLASMTIDERVDALLASGRSNLISLEMPKGSAGSRPWRFCALNLEKEPPEFVPVDPAEAVRLTLQSNQPIWVDPFSASLKAALQSRDDKRLNVDDIKKLQRRHGK